MIFKKIEMAGFKSFADHREIPFDNGVTAIVGPNGCGKSNVADSIRWVLGEQSSKLLRGQNMQDVIFKGTEKRKSLSYCEVSLYFDNTQKTFNINYDEVVLTRKLYRSGTSEYLINKNPVRLKDIVDLLHDSGIGKEGYSIIGQGRVEQIINSKPEDRRGIFEEAAGIAKFKARKVETERKLERVRENLQRNSDIMSEVERQIGPLKRQSEDAKRALELKQDLKHHEINTYIVQYENTNDIKEKISNVIAGIEEEISLRQNELETLNNEYNVSMEKFNSADEIIKKVNEEILHLSLNLQKLDSDNALYKERVNFITDQIKRSEASIEEYKNELEKNNNELIQSNSKLENQKFLVEKLNKEYKEVTDKYLQIVNDLTLSEDENKQANNQVIEALEKLTEIKANLSKLTTEKEVLAKSIQDNKQKITAINEKVKANQQIIDEINSTNSGVDVKKKDLETKIENYQKLYGDADLKIKLLEKDLNEAKTNRKLKHDRKNLISTMQADFEGYVSSVQRLLKDSTTNAELNKKVVGIVGQLIKVPAKLETAIEMALGNAINNVITKNEDDAKALISYLKDNKYGRATFLPLTSMKPRYIDKAFQSEMKMQGVLGVACELIEYNRDLDPIMYSLLGGTVIAENLEIAVNLAKKVRYAFKIVTLDGDIINPAGSLTGGSKKASVSNLLSRDREIETLTEEIKNLDSEIIVKEKEREHLSSKIIEYRENLNDCTQKLNKLNIDFASVFEKRARYEEFNQRLNEEFEELENQNKQSIIKINFIENEIASIDELENTINNARISAGESTKARSDLYDNMKVQKDKYNAEANEVRVKIASVEQEMLSVQDFIERMEIENKVLEERIENEQASIEKNKGVIQSIVLSLDNTVDVEKIKQQEEKLNKNKQRLAELESSKKILQENILKLDEQRTKVGDDISTLEKKKMGQDMQLQKVDIDLQNMQDRIYEEYKLTYETCMPYRATEYNINEGYAQINEIRKEINKIGPINISAIDDYKAVCERYEYMTEQTNDALKAEEELIQIIRDLSTEMVTRFNDQFDKINRNFTKIFSELFGGGSARLELVDNEDPLLAGVDILAQPPGKKLQTMTLMSGGEKALTAIAILFAILKLRPMPFCLLDEIEAALDDANVERFAKYLKRFSQDTQFIVITHRKPTMELADSLFGVTMEEPGVSKIVSVKLSDAVKNIEGNG
ncbi:MAG: chromosome segregation protein SMC [Clostridia bacterium]|nr:chromosome segregation protein SMC [Clostridia bacterium]